MINAEAHIDTKNNEGKTALMMAAMHGHVHCLERLIHAGSDMHLEDKNGVTPLGLAAIGMKNDVIKKLVSLGANVDVLDDNHKKTYAAEIKAGAEIFTAKNWKNSLQKQQNVRRLIRRSKYGA